MLESHRIAVSSPTFKETACHKKDRSDVPYAASPYNHKATPRSLQLPR